MFPDPQYVLKPNEEIWYVNSKFILTFFHLGVFQHRLFTFIYFLLRVFFKYTG